MKRLILVPFVLAAATRIASAQVEDPWNEQPTDPYEEPAESPTPTPTPAPAQEAEPETATATDTDTDTATTTATATDTDTDTTPKPPAKPEPPIDHPRVFSAPTGYLLPAGVIFSTTAIDTGGGFSSDWRVGLGNVAEFGLATTDEVRVRTPSTDPERLQPFVLATFKMGVGEGRLFTGHPALSLEFRKSFEHQDQGHTMRVAALSLTASKRIGKVKLHAGGVFWDALIETNENETLLHDAGTGEQLRAFGGFEIEPLADARIMVDLFWAPEFTYGEIASEDAIELKPILSWGVRYDIGSNVSLESGVRVPDIGDANLLNAQIFGQFTFTSRKLSRWIESVR